MAANDVFTSTSSTSRPDHAGFACSRIAIFNRSDHLLLARVGPLLVKELQAPDYVKQIRRSKRSRWPRLTIG